MEAPSLVMPPCPGSVWHCAPRYHTSTGGCTARGRPVLLCCSSPEPLQGAERREWEHKLLCFICSLCWTWRVRGGSWDTESNGFLVFVFLLLFYFLV